MARAATAEFCKYDVQLNGVVAERTSQVLDVLAARCGGLVGNFNLGARMTHNHVEQHPAYRILADHTVSFARERPLTMIARNPDIFSPDI